MGEVVGKEKGVIGFCRTRAKLLRGIADNVSHEGFVPKWCIFVPSGADTTNY
jgi:hypothetical protein